MNDAYSLKMLTKAAQCYEKAGLTADAIRVWLELENYGKAAEIYEQIEDWEAAIDCYLKAYYKRLAGQLNVRSPKIYPESTPYPKARLATPFII